MQPARRVWEEGFIGRLRDFNEIERLGIRRRSSTLLAFMVPSGGMAARQPME